MKRPLEVVVARGLVGGILAGAVVAVWFFALDAWQGRPFHTPAVLAHVFFARESPEITVPLVALYSILHLGAFALLGVVTAVALEASDTAPSLLGGAAFGVVVLDLVFYGALVATGTRIFTVLPWPHVLASNLVAGMVLMTYLHRANREERPFGLAALRGHPVVARGLVTGLVGAAVVALWFLALDTIAGQPFHTPAALASVLFLGATSPAEIRIGFGIVLAYTMLHVAAFAVFGTLLILLVRGVQRAPRLLLIMALGVIVLEAVVGPAIVLTAEWALRGGGWWSVAVANLLAVAAMGWWVWRTDPELRRTLRRPVEVGV